MEPAPPSPWSFSTRQREDGWTPEAMEDFIVALIETGSVRKAAIRVDRHVTTAYRLRGRVPEFAAAWDAARRMAYARLRDEAMERALDGTPQQVWKDGEWIGMKRVMNDRLLMNLLTHLRHEDPATAMRPRAIDDIEDAHSAAIATQLDVMAMLPPPPPVTLRPARGRLCIDAFNGVALA